MLPFPQPQQQLALSLLVYSSKVKVYIPKHALECLLNLNEKVEYALWKTRAQTPTRSANLVVVVVVVVEPS